MDRAVSPLMVEGITKPLVVDKNARIAPSVVSVNFVMVDVMFVTSDEASDGVGR